MTRCPVHHLRQAFLLSLLGLSLVLAGGTHAATFIPKITNPESYKDIQYGLTEMRENIDSVQCGGWNDNSQGQAVGTSVVNGAVPVPEVSHDVPGRDNINPLGNPASGIGTRGDFQYPDSAFGYSSACNLYDHNYNDEDLQRLGKDLRIYDDGTVGLVDGTGIVDVNPHDWCRLDMNKGTPKLCKRLFDAWQQAAAIMPREDPEALCPCNGPNCPPRPEKRYCFDAPYTFECRGASDTRSPVVSTFTDVPPQDTTCRTTWKPQFVNRMTRCHATPNGLAIDQMGQHIALSSSYYRHYAGAFMEPGVTVTAVTGETWDLRVECYEYYKERDPKVVVTDKEDEQCEIIIASGGEATPKSPEWETRDDQKGQRARDLPPESDRDDRNIPDPWLADSLTNLNLIDIKKLKENQRNFDDPTDVTSILGTLLTTRQSASKTVPDNARADMYDDTADRRFGEFWEEQQTELLTMVADPQTRLIMPARFLVGLADDDPLFQYVQHIATVPEGNVEITLKAGIEDVAGVLKSFQRIFVAPIQEVRVPVLVPLASVAELDARIADWKQWKEDEKREAAKYRKNAAAITDPAAQAKLLALADQLDATAPKADPLIAKLEQYRERVERVRLMRGGLISYLTKLYDSQRQIREYFASWYEQNTGMLQQATVRAEQRRELKRIWRLLERSMLQADACQLLYCSNQRYSLAVYSLLDSWWGDRAPDTPRNPDYKPASLKDLDYQQPKDQLFDFSNMKFPREPWLVPTLWPVEVRLRLPLPVLVGGTPPNADEFPDLPAIPDAHVFDAFTVPSFSSPDKPNVVIPTGSDLTEAQELLRTFRTIVDGTDVERQKEQEEQLKNGVSIGHDYFGTAEEGRGSMLDAYCRFPKSLVTPPREDQEQGNQDKIIHVESDLKERIARLFARWAPQRKEDYAGRVARLNQDFPNPNNPPACKENVICYFLPPEVTTSVIWQWFMPNSNGGNFTGLGDDVRNQTLPGSEQANPYFNASLDTLQRIFPRFDLPTITNFVPPPTP